MAILLSPELGSGGREGRHARIKSNPRAAVYAFPVSEVTARDGGVMVDT